jgi:hypothetical protein
MKRALGVLVVVFLLLPMSLPGQEGPPPEVKELDSWVGEWAYKIGESGHGTFTCEWLGNSFVKYTESYTNEAGATTGILGVFGYDAEAGLYTWERYWGNGRIDHLTGTVEGNVWTYTEKTESSTKRRAVITVESDAVKTFQWEESVDGGPWQVISEGRTEKVG